MVQKMLYGRPPQDLWIAVLHRACLDAMLSDNIKKGELPIARDDARRWFRDGGEDFREVCVNAGFDPGAVREAYHNGSLAKFIRVRTSS